MGRLPLLLSPRQRVLLYAVTDRDPLGAVRACVLCCAVATRPAAWLYSVARAGGRGGLTGWEMSPGPGGRLPALLGSNSSHGQLGNLLVRIPPVSDKLCPGWSGGGC